jgi:hypothetical protein
MSGRIQSSTVPNSDLSRPFEIEQTDNFDQNSHPGQLRTHKEIEKYLKEEKKAYGKFLAEPRLLILG